MLLLKNYLKICKFCNKILINKKTNLTTISISFLSVVKEFTINISEHKKMFHTNLNIFFNIKLKINIFINIFLMILKFLFLRNKDHYSKSFFKEKKFIIFSHLIDEKYLYKKKDYIFGNSIRELNKKNCSIVYLNHMRFHKKHINENLIKKFPLPLYILNFDINFLELMRIIKSCFRERKRLLGLINNNTSLLEKKIIYFSAAHALSTSTFNNLIFSKKIENIFNKLKPKAIISTFEGHSFERVLFAAAKNVNLDINTIGYQNTLLSKYQNSIFLKLNHKFCPNEIWSSGKISYEILKKKLPKKNIKNFGSIRFIDSHQNNHKKLFNNKILKCLVLPVGFYDSTFDLFIFTINYNKIYKNIHFIWRLHPELNFEYLKNKYPILGHYKDYNISLSNFDDVTKDFNRTDFVLYRHTTLISQATRYNLKLFYLDRDHEMNVDLLNNFNNSWKKNISTIKDLNTKTQAKNIKKTLRKDFIKVSNFCNNLYTKTNIKMIKKLST